MMEVKKGGRYVEGHEPETIAGMKYTTFRSRLGREKQSGEVDGPCHQALRQAEEIARQAKGDGPAEVETKGKTAAVIFTKSEPAEPVRAHVMVKPATWPPQRAEDAKPAAPAPQLMSGPERHATINITLKSRVEQHRHLKLMGVYTGRSVQDLVSTAVDEFIARNPIEA